jgi:hypothetical protein
MASPQPSALHDSSFRTYSFPRVTASRLIAAALLTALIAGAAAFVIAGMPGRTGLAVALGLGVVVAALWIVVLRQPSAVTVGKEVVIRFPIGSRRYASNDLLKVTSEVRRGGFLFLGMHVSATTFWTFRMSDGRTYTVPVPTDVGEPG